MAAFGDMDFRPKVYRITPMNKTLFTLTLIAIFVSLAAAQESKISLTARDSPQAVSAQPDSKQIPSSTSSNLPFCPPKTCLYYAGDFDSTDSNANGLFNGNDEDGGLWASVWVGIKPPKAVIVTGVTFNQFFTAGFTGTNPTPFAAQTNILAGQNNGGTIVCNTTGNATLREYGESDFGLVQYSYTVKKLATRCRIPKPSKKSPSIYVNLYPQSANGYGYLVNVEDTNPKNHRGWENDLDDCWFLSEPFQTGIGGYYQTCNTQGVFDEMSIALTGKKTK